MAGSQAPLAKVSVGSAVKAALLMEFHYSQASERKSVTSMADVFPDALRASSNKGDQIWEPYPCCRNIICACLLHQGKMLLGCALLKYLLTLAVKIPGKQYLPHQERPSPCPNCPNKGVIHLHMLRIRLHNFHLRKGVPHLSLAKLKPVAAQIYGGSWWIYATTHSLACLPHATKRSVGTSCEVSSINKHQQTMDHSQKIQMTGMWKDQTNDLSMGQKRGKWTRKVTDFECQTIHFVGQEIWRMPQLIIHPMISKWISS